LYGTALSRGSGGSRTEGDARGAPPIATRRNGGRAGVTTNDAEEAQRRRERGAKALAVRLEAKRKAAAAAAAAAAGGGVGDDAV
jgi:hypothetical protein